MDNQQIIALTIVIILIFALLYYDWIMGKIREFLSHWIYHNSKNIGIRDIPTKTFRDWLFVLLGSAITFGVRAMILQDWQSLVILIVAFILMFIIIAVIDSRQERKEAERWNKFERDVRKDLIGTTD